MKIPMALWPRLMPLLDEVLVQPPEQREAWLRAQTLDDEMLAALRQLLADREELDGGAFMAELPKLEPLAPTPGQPEAGPNSVSQSGLFAGDMLGPYRLIKPLGQGGMSVVWLAERDDGQIRRQVALKMPHAGPGQALLAERLRRERDILASLEHRHIARLYDVGTAPTGLPFMVLEYIEGQPLPAYCDEHHLHLHERLQLFLQVLSAVQYAHTKLVLHRDLKPSNILVNGQGEVKLLDFGIAKLIQGSETGAVAPSTELTQHNGHVLTPDYAAPEQIAGAPLTTASDVYALGVILFELLTGQRPYRLPRGTRGALEEAILATDARRPSQVWLDGEVQTHHPTAVTVSDLAEHFKASPRRLSQQLRGDLDVIVATALQKQTARRYATAEAFAQDIQHHLAKEPIAAQPDSRWYRTGKYVQRHAWALSAVGAVVAALSVGLGVALWQAEQARQEAAKANAIKDFLVGLFENGDVEQPDALRKRQQTVEQLLVNSAHALGTQLKDQPRVRVELQGVVGGLLHNLAITDEAIALRKQRVAQLEAMGAPVAERAQALRELADSQDARGDTAGAAASLEAGLTLCRTDSMYPVDICRGLQVARAHLAIIARDMVYAEKLIDEALSVLQRSAGDSHQFAEALVAKGDLLSLKGDNEHSFSLYEEALNVHGRTWGSSSVRLAQERYVLGTSLAQVGRFQQAIQELKKAHAALVAALGSGHVQCAIIEMQLGRFLTFVGLEQGGREHVNHASKILISRAAEVDPRTIYLTFRTMAEVALFDGRLAEAEPQLREAMAMQLQLGDKWPVDGHLETAMAWYLDDTGQGDRARAVLMDVRGKLISRFGADHQYVQEVDEAMASSLISQKRWGDAERWMAERFKPDPSGRQLGSSSRTAYLMARGLFKEAAPYVNARLQALEAGRRSDQFQLSVYSAQDQMGRLQAGLGHHKEACSYFERAIGTLASGYADNPYLGLTRARYGLSLLEMGDLRRARREADLARQALSAHARLASYFREPLLLLERRLKDVSD